MIWVKCKIPVLIEWVSALRELFPSFLYSECWEIGECRLHTVEQGALGCIPEMFHVSHVVQLNTDTYTLLYAFCEHCTQKTLPVLGW